MELTVSDLAQSYFKAKVDLFYSNDDRALELLSYEANLEENLESLRDRLNSALSFDPLIGPDYSDLLTHDFLGTGIIMPKRINESGDDLQLSVFTKASSDWRTNEGKRFNGAEFRILSRCSIEMHIVSELWITHIGTHLDKRLGIEAPANGKKPARASKTAAYGNRIRRTRDGEYNSQAPGALKPYLFQYQRWQNNGYRAISDALDREESVVSISTDVRAFFPSLDPAFLIDKDFASYVELSQLGEWEQDLHSLFVEALVQWREAVATDLGMPAAKVGLPIGLPSSGIIANVALLELDAFVEKQLNPLFYGRYVDDVILVMRRNSVFVDADSVIKWILQRAKYDDKNDTLLHCVKDTNSDDPQNGTLSLAFTRSYLESSKIEFGPQKSRILFFEGLSGKITLTALRKSDQARASEWRELPELPEEAPNVGREFIALVDEQGATALSLGHISRITTQKASFALKLRTVEAYAKDLIDSSWAEHRSEFFNAIVEFALTPANFFALESYLPRILNVAIRCDDWESLVRSVEAVAKCFKTISKALDSTEDFSIVLNGEKLVHQRDEVVIQWGARLSETIIKTLTQGSSVEIPVDFMARINTLLADLPEPSEVVSAGARVRLSKPSIVQSAPLNAAGISKTFMQLFFADLASVPLRVAVLPSEWHGWNPDRSQLAEAPCLPEGIYTLTNVKKRVEAFRSLTSQVEGENRSFGGAGFPTRPAALSEIFAATRMLSLGSDPENNTHLEHLGETLTALRGYSIDAEALPRISEGPGCPVIHSGKSTSHEFHHPYSDRTVDVAVGMLEMDELQLTQATHNRPHLSRERYAKIIRIVNQVIHDSEKISYLVLPELSIPARWYQRIANKLRSSGISFIAGVEYKHNSRESTQVHNQVWVSLTHSEWGFPGNAIYIQDKRLPAHKEALNLLNEAGKTLEPEAPWSSLPIIDHQGFRFSVLICSELTNIDHRAAVRGRIDALFIPEWNPDTETFSALVESAAYDIHCYVVQANNRKYGDSRIRAPKKQRFERDVARVSGGVRDNVIVGRLDVSALRYFQSRKSPQGNVPFKPLPDGFVIDDDRSIFGSNR